MSRLVHLRPVPGRFIPGVSMAEQDVTPEEAETLLAYTPAAFTADPSAVLRHRREDITSLPEPPPEPPAVQSPAIPVEEAGITDSRE